MANAVLHRKKGHHSYLLMAARLHMIKPKLFAPNVKRCTNMMLMMAFCMWFN